MNAGKILDKLKKMCVCTKATAVDYTIQTYNKLSGKTASLS